jgi:hypothetical protein
MEVLIKFKTCPILTTGSVPLVYIAKVNIKAFGFVV